MSSSPRETFGRYRLLERLGQGGMAEVFKAKSFGVEGFEKVLVIKRILPELAKHPEFVDMFVHEAKLAVRLSHANIVQVFDLGVADGASYFMAMEFVHGFDLATLLTRCRRQQVTLPIDMCVYIAAEVAKGLDHAHRRRDEQLRPLGVVHRDVSPQNVLLSYEGEVKVTDFGIAKARGVLDAQSEDTKTRQLHGKFGYMSPEQARGEEVDARSDLFSLGVLLYECVAGVNPFSAPTTFETLRRVQACEYPPVELLRPDAPAELVAIVKTALAKDREARYADAGRMYEAMLAFLYAQGSRFGANDLAEFLARFRTDDAAAGSSLLPDRLLEGEPGAAQSTTAERTPVEVPAASRAALTPSSSSIPIPPPSSHATAAPGGSPSSSNLPGGFDTGVHYVGIDRAVGMGERREITALVIEFPRRDSEALCARAIDILGRYGGRVVRKEPEHVAALFGLGEPDGRDTEVATRCALVALRAMDAGSIEDAPSAGLHSARIHVSQTGEPTEDERMLSLLATAREFARARAGRCAISAAALRQVRGLFDVEPLMGLEGDQPRTGLTGSIVKDVRSPQDAYGRFVGRKDELRTLGEALASATKRKPRVLTLRGDHGIGKTRLLFEVERRLLRGTYNVGFYVASCPPRGRELPLSGIVAMLQVLCGVSETDPAERILAVQPRLRALGLLDDEVTAILTALGAPVVTATGAPPVSGNATSALKHAFGRMVAGLCEDKPYVFAWDAAHCMDEDSLAVVDAAFERLPQTRCVFLLTGRAGFSHPLEQRRDHVVVDLVDLKPDDAERLVAARLGVDAVPDELTRFVRERAGGHPQFIEEVLKALLDAQAVTIADRRVVSMRLLGQELALPKTLRGLVASRVSRLAPADRATLQAAAVLGDPVDAAVLAHMLGQPMTALEGSLAELKKRELLVHTGPSELRFTSPIVREVVVDALTHEAARQMHAACGHSLEQVLGDKAVEQAARLATHLYESGQSDRAAGYFAKSGERRFEARQLEAAAKDYARAITLADVSTRTPAEIAGWFHELTQAVRMVRACPDANEIVGRVLARADGSVDRTLRVSTRIDAGVLLSALHKFDAARAQLESAERLARDDEELAKKALAATTDLATRQGDFAGTLALLDRLQRIATDEGDRAQEHKVLCHRAQAHAGLGDRRAALGALASAEELLPDDAAAACERQKLRALVEYFARDFRAAVALAEKAVDMARALGVGYEVAINLHNLGDFLIHMEDFARAYGAIRQSIALCDEGGFERLASQNRMFLAFLDGAAGDAEAVELLRQGIRYAEAHDYTWDAVNGRYLLGHLLQRKGELAHARAELEKARARAKESGNRLVEGDCEAALKSIAS